MKWIPVEMIQEVLTKREVNAFKVYVVMNHYHNGYFKASKSSYEFIMKHCAIKSLKTVRKHLKTLIRLGYLGFDGKTYYIRSYQRFIKKNKYRVEFSTNYLKNWKAYLSGAFVGYLAYQQRKVEKAIRSQTNGASNQKLPSSFPVSNESVKSTLKYSIANSHYTKDLAHIKGFMFKESGGNQLIEVTKEAFLIHKRNLQGCFLIKDKVYKRLPDKVTPLLRYKRGKRKTLIC